MFCFEESSTKAKGFPWFLGAMLSTFHAPFQYMPHNGSDTPSKGSH